jgi:hypothetical protein
MATVGVKSSRAIGAAAATRGLQVIGYFPVLSKSAGEMVMGGATGISPSESRSWCARTHRNEKSPAVDQMELIKG